MSGNAYHKPVYWDGEREVLMILDQRKLPHKVEYLEIKALPELIQAIKTLAVRGAPLLGIAAAYGTYLGVRDFEGEKEKFLNKLDEVIAQISATRPTAVNLFAALRRIQEMLQLAKSLPVGKIKKKILALGHRILEEEEGRSFAIARNGADILGTSVRVLTHCNTGALAAAGVGTALGIIYEGFQRGYVEMVYVDETRPLLQGARLTAWELSQWGIPHRIIADGAAAYFMQKGEIDVVVVGADRIVRNGDVANKIGTYSLAVAAKRHGIPFIVAAPTSTFDLSILEGAQIPIEMRDESEVLEFAGRRIAPEGSHALNPAFDITPASLISAIVTERGVIEKPNIDKIASHIGGGYIDLAEL